MPQVPLRVSTLITPKDLAEKMTSSANFRVLDCTWHMPLMGFSGKKNARQDFYKDHIPGAQFFDIGECCDKESRYEQMLPSEEQFAECVGKLGINNNTHVIVYDNNANFGLFSAQRVWWMFRVFGHNLVTLLDGGLPRWVKEGYYTTDDVEKLSPQTFHAKFNKALVKTFEEMEANLEGKTFQVVDARPQGRYEGTQSEPVPGIKPGHMPDAINVPFSTLLDLKEKRLKPKGDLLEVLEKAGVDISKPIVASCGTGLVACVIALVGHVCDKKDISVFDGSWNEWYLRSKFEHRLNVPK